MVQPRNRRCMKFIHRLKADEMPIETLGCNPRSAAAHKRIENRLAFPRRQIYQERNQSDGLLGFMDSPFLFHEPELKNICRANAMSLAGVDIHGADTMFKDIARNGAAYAVGLDEPSNGLEHWGQVSQPPATPLRRGFVQTSPLEHQAYPLGAMVGRFLLPSKHVLQKKPAVLEGVRHPMNGAARTEHKDGAAVLQFGEHHLRP